MASMIFAGPRYRYVSTKFDWIIKNFSEVNSEEGLCSDVFSVGSFEWRLKIYPKGHGKVYKHLSVYLIPVDLNKFPVARFSVSVHNQMDHSDSARKVMKHKGFNKHNLNHRGWKRFMLLSELHDPDNGYILHDTCILKIRISCRTAADAVSEDVNESNPEMVMQSVEYSGAGQPFDRGQNNNNVGFGADREEFEDIGGFHILKTQAPLYRQIWLKYGHIPSTNVMLIASYPILAMMVKDLMRSITDMHKCHYVDLSSEMIERWEGTITMAEKFEFNIGWLRERFEHVKKGMCGMQNVKMELMEHGQNLHATKSKIRGLGDVMTNEEVQLVDQKDDAGEKMSELLS